VVRQLVILNGLSLTWQM